MKLFNCARCAAQIYFENMHCGSCGASLGFVPEELTVAAFDAVSPPWVRLGVPESEAGSWRACANRHNAWGCNWMVPASQVDERCLSCRMTRTDISALVDLNPSRWMTAESAKRHLLYTLLSLQLPIAPKRDADDVSGLAFVWQVGGPDFKPITGHANGTITLDLLEADDDQREAARVALAESQRTILGHLRHEVSHHLHQRLVEGTTHEAAFLQLFGDPQQDYAQALQRHYDAGPPPDWPANFISAYATAHPWEDWAETCAHYLLIIDAVESAAAWGLSLRALPKLKLRDPHGTAGMPLEELVIHQWLPVSRFLNAMARSIGLRDSYPFTMPNIVLAKLHFVQEVLRSQHVPQADGVS
jgi:hypothetical protein